ncbi:MAG: hypothetical protein H0W33_06725 [Gammaproteobacteria bacterium]|nr:hypothetical protein [Gammaproteobacteria bacterium]
MRRLNSFLTSRAHVGLALGAFLLSVCPAFAGIVAGDTNGIVGGDSNGIVGGDTNGIVGGDTNGIVGGDTNGIVGGDTNGIVGGDTNGIVGGDKNGTVGGDKNGIVGGDTNGIVGGDKNGIVGGDTNGIVGGDNNGIVGGDTNDIIGRDENLALVGPIDAVNTEGDVFQALGQQIVITEATLFTQTNGSLNGTSNDLWRPGRGDLVAVSGRVLMSGIIIASTIRSVHSQNVPGATSLYLKGMLNLVDQTVGTATIGGLTVDYTATLSRISSALVRPGNIIELIGIKPLEGGKFIALSGSVDGIVGGDFDSLSGGDLAGL